jgi:DNA-binding CsgD family transcriptional regulator
VTGVPRPSRWYEAELLENCELVQAAPPLDDAAVLDTEDVDAVQRERLAGAWYSHELAAVCSAGGEHLGNEVVFGDELFDVAVPVGQRLPVHARREPHAFRPVRRVGERGVMVDEVAIEIALDGLEVALGEQVLDERLDELLVLGELVGSHGTERVRVPGAAPSHLPGISAGTAAAHTAGMPRSASLVRVEQDAVRLCHSGLDSAGVRREVLRAVRRLMPVDAAFFATADPETLLFTGAWPDEPLDAATHQFLDNEFGGTDVNKFAVLATSERHVATLDDATWRDRRVSPRYREIMRPLGLGDELRAALVADGRCWGYVCLHREDAHAGFAAAEAAALARLAPHIAHALRVATLLHGTSVPDRVLRPGVVLLAEDLNLVAVTPEAEQLLSLLVQDEPNRSPLPTAVYAVAVALQALERGGRDASTLPSTRIATRTGTWVRVHASRLNGHSAANQLVVILEPVEPRAMVPLILSAYGLSAREAEVATFVLRGHATHAIADTLHISGHTVQDHLKSVFDKTGVRSRRDLVGRLLAAGTASPEA